MEKKQVGMPPKQNGRLDKPGGVKSKYGHRFENPQAKSNFCKRFFRTKIYQITKFLLHSEWCPSDKISAMIFHAKKHSHVVPVHANVQMEAPTAPRGFDFGPLEYYTLVGGFRETYIL